MISPKFLSYCDIGGGIKSLCLYVEKYRQSVDPSEMTQNRLSSQKQHLSLSTPPNQTSLLIL